MKMINLIKKQELFTIGLFELQAEIINKEIEIARAKKEQVGPIVKKKK